MRNLTSGFVSTSLALLMGISLFVSCSSSPDKIEERPVGEEHVSVVHIDASEKMIRDGERTRLSVLGWVGNNPRDMSGHVDIDVDGPGHITSSGGSLWFEASGETERGTRIQATYDPHKPRGLWGVVTAPFRFLWGLATLPFGDRLGEDVVQSNELRIFVRPREERPDSIDPDMLREMDVNQWR